MSKVPLTLVTTAASIGVQTGLQPGLQSGLKAGLNAGPQVALPIDAPIEPQRPLLTTAALDQLRDLIVLGEIAPGARLNERLLCQRLGVSRTPLRESIKTLAAEGLVELQPNRGAIVSPVTVSKVREVFAVMAALESLAGELACRNASDADLAEIRSLHYQMVAHYKRGELREYIHCNQKIHLRLVDSADNATLAQTYRQLNAQVRRARYQVNFSPERWAEAVAEHEAMLAALDARDAERLKAILRDHLGDQMVMVLASLEVSATLQKPVRRERRA